MCNTIHLIWGCKKVTKNTTQICGAVVRIFCTIVQLCTHQLGFFIHICRHKQYTYDVCEMICGRYSRWLIIHIKNISKNVFLLWCVNELMTFDVSFSFLRLLLLFFWVCLWVFLSVDKQYYGRTQKAKFVKPIACSHFLADSVVEWPKSIAGNSCNYWRTDGSTSAAWKYSCLVYYSIFLSYFIVPKTGRAPITSVHFWLRYDVFLNSCEHEFRPWCV